MRISRVFLPAAAATFVLFASGCASSQSASGLGNTKVDIIKPELKIIQLNTVASAARYESGPMPVHFALRVVNRSAEPIILTRVQVQTVGQGAYTISEGAGSTASQAFKKEVKPDHFEVVDFWVPAVAMSTINGANGPVTVRCIAHFDSPVGQFQEIVIQQVHDVVGGQTPE
jgi:hypothetical protein